MNCNKNNTSMMIRCDGCGKWAHFRCADIDQKDWNTETDFICKICNDTVDEGVAKSGEGKSCGKPDDSLLDITLEIEKQNLEEVSVDTLMTPQKTSSQHEVENVEAGEVTLCNDIANNSVVKAGEGKNCDNPKVWLTPTTLEIEDLNNVEYVSIDPHTIQQKIADNKALCNNTVNVAVAKSGEGKTSSKPDGSLDNASEMEEQNYVEDVSIDPQMIEQKISSQPELEEVIACEEALVKRLNESECGGGSMGVNNEVLVNVISWVNEVKQKIPLSIVVAPKYTFSNKQIMYYGPTESEVSDKIVSMNSVVTAEEYFQASKHLLDGLKGKGNFNLYNTILKQKGKIHELKVKNAMNIIPIMFMDHVNNQLKLFKVKKIESSN